MGKAAGGADDGGEVFDLAIDLVWWRIAAVAASPPVVGINGEVGGQQLGQRCEGGACCECGGHQDKRRAVSGPVSGDGGAVSGCCLDHRNLLVSSCSR